MKLGRKFYIVFISVWIIGVVCSTIFLVSSNFMGLWDPFNKPELTEVVFCSELDPFTNKPVQIPNKISDQIDDIHICGYLTTTVPLRLSVLCYEKSITRPFFVEIDTFENGYFIHDINFNRTLDPGEYRVEIWHGRQTIAAILLLIEEE